MINWLTSIPILFGGVVAAIAAIMIGFLSYFAFRFVAGPTENEEGKGLALSIFGVVATMLSLFLSLTLADLRQEIGEVRNTVIAEAELIADVYKDLSAFDTIEANEIKAQIEAYLGAVAEIEWPALASGTLSDDVIDQHEQIEIAILSLKAETPLQEILHSRLIADADAIGTYRTIRLVKSASRTPVFMYVAVLGFVWTTALLGVYEPHAKSLGFVASYCAFFGLVMYIILALGNYFEGIGGVTPSVFEDLAEMARRARLE